MENLKNISLSSKLIKYPTYAEFMDMCRCSKCNNISAIDINNLTFRINFNCSHKKNKLLNPINAHQIENETETNNYLSPNKDNSTINNENLEEQLNKNILISSFISKCFNKLSQKNNKSNFYLSCSVCNKENDLWKCKNCNSVLCNQHKLAHFSSSYHSDFQSLKELENQCQIHKKLYSYYCINCDANICSYCKNLHKEMKHEIIDLADLIPNKKKLEKINKDLEKEKYKIDDIIKDINSFKKKINEGLELLVENINIIYNLKLNILKSFDWDDCMLYQKLENFKRIKNIDTLNSHLNYFLQSYDFVKKGYHLLKCIDYLSTKNIDLNYKTKREDNLNTFRSNMNDYIFTDKLNKLNFNNKFDNKNEQNISLFKKVSDPTTLNELNYDIDNKENLDFYEKIQRNIYETKNSFNRLKAFKFYQTSFISEKQLIASLEECDLVYWIEVVSLNKLIVCGTNINIYEINTESESTNFIKKFTLDHGANHLLRLKNGNFVGSYEKVRIYSFREDTCELKEIQSLDVMPDSNSVNKTIELTNGYLVSCDFCHILVWKLCQNVESQNLNQNYDVKNLIKFDYDNSFESSDLFNEQLINNYINNDNLYNNNNNNNNKCNMLNFLSSIGISSLSKKNEKYYSLHKDINLHTVIRCTLQISETSFVTSQNSEKTLRFFNTTTFEEEKIITGIKSNGGPNIINLINENYFAVCLGTGIYIFDVKSKEKILFYESKECVTFIAPFFDGTLICACKTKNNEYNLIQYLFNEETGLTEIGTKRCVHKDVFWCHKIIWEKGLLCTGSYDKTIKIWK